MPNAVFRLLAGMNPSSRDRAPSRSRAAVKPRAPGAARAVAERLEERRLLAVTTLNNGAGDATLSITVDAYGSFGSNTTAGDAFYNPIGPATPQGSTYESGVYFSLLGNFLSESNFGGPGPALPPIAFTSVTGTTAVSSFTVAGLSIGLTQTLLPATATGSNFSQTYVITNSTVAPATFQMIRHVDGDLFFFGSFANDFAGASVDGRVLFEFDTATDPSQSTAYLGITASGDGAPAGFTIQPYPYRNAIVAGNGIIPSDLNEVSGDLNGDRLTDTGYDVTISLADLFTVAPGASVSYTTTTIFSQGSPLAILNPGVFEFSSPTYSVDENAGTATITVNRTQGDIGAVSVDYVVTPGTATAGVDYTPVSGTLLFADRQTTATITVPIIDDLIGEGDETLTLGLTNPQGGAVVGTPSVATLTIVEDDLAVLFVPQSYTVDETAGVATLTVLRTGPTTAPITVRFATADATAISPSDYLQTAGLLEFGVGQRTALINVPVISDFDDVEQTETFTVTLSAPTGAALGVFTVATVEVLNVDRPPSVFDITAFAPSGRIEALYLQVQDPLRPERVLDASNYDLYQHTERSFNSQSARRRVAISTVQYNAEVKTITIRPKSVLKSNVFYEVVLRSTTENGIISTSGEPLDGNFDRVAGDGISTADDFIGYFGRGTRLQFFDHDGDRVRLGATGGGVIEVFRDITRDARQVRYVGAVPATSAIFGRLTPSRRNSDRATIVNTLLLNGARSFLSPPILTTYLSP